MNCSTCNAKLTPKETTCSSCGAKNVGVISSLKFSPVLLGLLCVYGLINGISVLTVSDQPIQTYFFSGLVSIASLVGLVFLLIRGIKKSKTRSKSKFSEKIKILIGLPAVKCSNCDQNYVDSDSFCRNCGVKKPRHRALIIIFRSCLLVAFCVLILTGLVAGIEYLLILLGLGNSFQVSIAMITGVAGLMYLSMFFLFLNAVVSFFTGDD